MPGTTDMKPGNTPAHPDAWSKVRLGFAAVDTVAPAAYTKTNLNGINASNPTSSNFNVLKVTPGTGKQYFLVENRQLTGYDRALYDVTAGVTGGGILIWHVDEAPFDVYDNRGTTSQSRGNDNNGHRGLDLEKLWPNNSTAKDKPSNPFYVAGPTGTFDATTAPNSNFHQGTHRTNPFSHVNCCPQTVASSVQLNVRSASGSVMEVASGPFTAVTSVTGVPTAAPIGRLPLTATVNPANATNRTIYWSVVSAGGTGAAISGNNLTTAATGTVTVRATITNGEDLGVNYTQDFTITVSPPNFTLTPSTAHTFPTAQFGYAAPAALSVQVSNTAAVPTGQLAISLSNPASFLISSDTLNSVAVSAAGTFTVVPRAGLGLGIYTATVTVSGGYVSRSFNVSFTVNPSSARDIIAVSSPGGASISGTAITVSVANGVGSAAVNVAVSPGAGWRLYSDAACTAEITSKTMGLEVGANTAYIKVTAQNGTDTKVYALTVNRAAPPPPPKKIFSTKYDATIWNWLMFFVLFGFIWMWF